MSRQSQRRERGRRRLRPTTIIPMPSPTTSSPRKRESIHTRSSSKKCAGTPFRFYHRPAVARQRIALRGGGSHREVYAPSRLHPMPAGARQRSIARRGLPGALLPPTLLLDPCSLQSRHPGFLDRAPQPSRFVRTSACRLFPRGSQRARGHGRFVARSSYRHRAARTRMEGSRCRGCFRSGDHPR